MERPHRLIEKIDEVKRSVAEGHSDLSQFTVHLWISLAFAMKSKPPYNIELNEDDVETCVNAICKLQESCSSFIRLPRNEANPW
jgi:hypothetical protein